MYQFFILIRNFYYYIFRLFDSVSFDINGVKVSLLGIFVGFLLLSIIIAYFWKGARG